MNTRRLAAMAAAFLLATGAGPAGADDSDARIRMLEEQIRVLQQQMQQLIDARTEESAPAVAQPTAATAAQPAAEAPAQAPATEARVDEVERRQGILTDEVRALREALVLPEDKELKSQYGLAPAASKVYSVERGLSIGGYGEFNYKGNVADQGSANDEFDFLRLILYAGYKFNDWIVFNSEIEFEHASTGKDGEVSVEFAALDFLLHPMVNVRAGMVLVPMGFINEIHEPPFFHGNMRPQVEQRIIPSTWRSNGIGLFGELLPGLNYRTYAITSLDAKGFSSSGIRGGRQSGSIELANDWSWVARLDYSPIDELTVSGAALLGNQGQGQEFGNERDGFVDADVFTQIYETHIQLRTHGLEARALGAWIEMDDADVLSMDADINPAILDDKLRDQPVAGSQWGWYAELAYDILPLVFPNTTQYFAPWFRYSFYDTQDSVPGGFTGDARREVSIWEVGVSYKPVPQVVLKLDYRNQDSNGAELPDEVRIGAGFVF
jgi:hypothetical protein